MRVEIAPDPNAIRERSSGGGARKGLSNDGVYVGSRHQQCAECETPARAGERANEGEGHESKINNYIDNLYFTRDPVT